MVMDIGFLVYVVVVHRTNLEAHGCIQTIAICSNVALVANQEKVGVHCPTTIIQSKGIIHAKVSDDNTKPFHSTLFHCDK